MAPPPSSPSMAPPRLIHSAPGLLDTCSQLPPPSAVAEKMSGPATDTPSAIQICRPRTVSRDPSWILFPVPTMDPRVPFSRMLHAVLHNPAASPAPPTGLWLHPKGGGRNAEEVRSRKPGRGRGTGRRVYPPSSGASYRACPTPGRRLVV
ncbi:hypothetical protein I79_025397 [Cricetulus griseus]|uniref:Uncharacterized protein n=1 Tax=Cricetulus griseus TaxID=10029 RepID=G3IN85_CRIGR|nr:hypothetical protein I79_025397 [Cricetulus griseus]